MESWLGEGGESPVFRDFGNESFCVSAAMREKVG